MENKKQLVTDPDLEAICMVNEAHQRRDAARQYARERYAAERARQNARRRSFWRTLRRGVLECGSCLAIAILMAAIACGGKLPPLRHPVQWPAGSDHAGE